jgi:MFS family permease
MLAAFIVLESRLTNPIFPLRILRLRGLTGTSIVRAFLVTGMFSTFLLGVLYLEHVRHYGALETGVAFLPLTLMLGALSLGITARIMRRFGPTPVLLVGLTSIVAALLLLSRVGDHASYFPAIVVPFTLLGLGAGLAFLPLMTVAMADVPPRDAGLASGIVNSSLQISGALGIAVLATIAADRTKVLDGGGSSTAHALTGGFDLAWLVAAATVAVGALVALAVLRSPGAASARAVAAGGSAALDATPE